MALLDGLEAVEISLSKLERTFRLDSEFFKKEYIYIEKSLKEQKYYPLTDIVTVSDGNHMKISDSFTEKGIPYYRGQDVSSFFIEQSTPICITESAFNKPVMKRSYLKKSDILLSIVGTIGKLSLVKEDNKATCSCKLAILRPKQKDTNFISIFLESKYGKLQIDRLTRGAVQKGLLLEDMDQLLVPYFSNEFKNKINSSIDTSFTKLEQSETLYKQAENSLLEELGLLGYEPSVESISIKSFSTSFENSGRLDSEYYLPKYETIINRITSKNSKKLSQLVNIKKSIEPGSSAYQKEGIPFVRVSNLTKFGLSEPDIHLAKNIVDMKELIPKRDTILLSKDGTVGIAYAIKNEAEMITSGAILHLSRKDESVQVEYLTLVLNSMLVQMQSERDAGGSIIKHWKPSEIAEVVIPIIDMSIQIKIEENIKTSFELKEESKVLLELAKKAVEVAIEENEDKAIKFIGAYNE